MNRKSATLYFSIVAILLGFQTAFAQNIGYLGRTHSLTIKGIAPFSVSSCNLEITLPDGEKVEKEVNAPDFETKVDFVPKSVGRNLIEWEGKLKLRGFNPILGCTGGEKIFVEVTYPKQAQLDEKDIELLATARQFARDKKISEAFPIFKQLAEKGHAQSQAFVAVAYYRGEGTTRNFAEAFKWASLSAETEAISMNLLGIMYLNGHGVKQDCDLAVKYYRSAIEKNNVNAMINLGRAYLSGRCVASDPAEAKPLLDRAASLGNALAMFSLGGMYEKGQGVERDEKAAIEWYRKASDKGDEAAKKELARLEAAEASALKDKQRIQAEQLAKKEEEEINARFLSSPDYKKQQLEIAKQEQERLERQRLVDERKVVEDQRRLQQQEKEKNEKCCRSIFFQTRQGGDAQRWVGDPIISIHYLKSLSGTHKRSLFSEDGLIQVTLDISPNGIASLRFSREIINLPKIIWGTWQSNNGKVLISFENKWFFQAEVLSRLFRNPNERYPKAPLSLFLQSSSAPFFLTGEYSEGGEMHFDSDKRVNVDASRYQNPSNVLPQEYERRVAEEQKRQQQLEIARREQLEKERLERQRVIQEPQQQQAKRERESQNPLQRKEVEQERKRQQRTDAEAGRFIDQENEYWIAAYDYLDKKNLPISCSEYADASIKKNPNAPLAFQQITNSGPRIILIFPKNSSLWTIDSNQKLKNVDVFAPYLTYSVNGNQLTYTFLGHQKGQRIEVTESFIYDPSKFKRYKTVYKGPSADTIAVLGHNEKMKEAKKKGIPGPLEIKCIGELSNF